MSGLGQRLRAWRALRLARAGRVDEAASLVAADGPGALAALGEQLIDQGDEAGAQQVLARARGARVGDDLVGFLATTGATLSNVELLKAERDRLAPFDLAGVRKLAQRFVAQGAKAEAAALLESWARRHIDLPLYLDTAELLADLGRLPDALTWARRGLDFVATHRAAVGGEEHARLLELHRAALTELSGEAEVRADLARQGYVDLEGRPFPRPS